MAIYSYNSFDVVQSFSEGDLKSPPPPVWIGLKPNFFGFNVRAKKTLTSPTAIIQQWYDLIRFPSFSKKFMSSETFSDTGFVDTVRMPNKFQKSC